MCFDMFDTFIYHRYIVKEFKGMIPDGIMKRLLYLGLLILKRVCMYGNTLVLNLLRDEVANSDCPFKVCFTVTA